MINKDLILKEFGKKHTKGYKPYGAMLHLLNYGSITIREITGYPLFSNGANKVKQALQDFFDERKDLGYEMTYTLEKSNNSKMPFRKFYLKELEK